VLKSKLARAALKKKEAKSNGGPCGAGPAPSAGVLREVMRLEVALVGCRAAAEAQSRLSL
jgi:hypothetical protein